VAEAMPTEQDYARAREALSRAFDELDRITFLFAENLGEHGNGDEIPNPLLDPSIADVGTLYSFTQDVRFQIADFQRYASKLTTHLQALDGVRLDLEAARRQIRDRVAQYCGDA
jgi:hypothetical protein